MKTAVFTLCTILTLSALPVAQTPTLTRCQIPFSSAPMAVETRLTPPSSSSYLAQRQRERRLRPGLPSSRINAEVLRTNGIDPKSAEIGFFSVNPQTITKVRSTKSLVSGDDRRQREAQDFSKIGAVTHNSQMKRQYSQSLSYTLDSNEDAKTKAVADAYRRARASAQSLAAASGSTLVNSPTLR